MLREGLWGWEDGGDPQVQLYAKQSRRVKGQGESSCEPSFKPFNVSGIPSPTGGMGYCSYYDNSPPVLIIG